MKTANGATYWTAWYLRMCSQIVAGSNSESELPGGRRRLDTLSKQSHDVKSIAALVTESPPAAGVKRSAKFFAVAELVAARSGAFFHPLLLRGCRWRRCNSAEHIDNVAPLSVGALPQNLCVLIGL